VAAERIVVRYFNQAGLAPVSKDVEATAADAHSRFAQSLFSDRGVRLYAQILDECRAALAELLGLPGAQTVALLPNATTGLNIAISELQIRPGQEILTTDQEHPAVDLPLAALTRRGVTVRQVPAVTHDGFVSAVGELVSRHRPAAIILSHVSYKNGRVLPVEEVGKLAASYDIPYIVDGAQAAGHVPVDVEATRAWVYVLSGHKWLHGPMGSGAMVADERFLATCTLPWSSWMWKSSRPSARQFESGTMNVALMAGLRAAATHAIAEGAQRWKRMAEVRHEIIRALLDVPEWTLQDWEAEQAPGIVAYALPDTCPSWEVSERLSDEYQVVVKPFAPPEKPNALRISIGPWTTSEDVSQLIDAIKHVSRCPPMSRGTSMRGTA